MVDVKHKTNNGILRESHVIFHCLLFFLFHANKCERVHLIKKFCSKALMNETKIKSLSISDRYSLFFKSASQGHFDVVKFLVKNGGVDIHHESDKALRCAASNGHLDIVEFLKEEGSYIDVRDNAPLKESASNGHLNIVKYLIENDMNSRIDDDFPFRKSASNGHLDVAKYLIEQGSDIHANYDQAFRVSAHNGHFDVVKFLIEKGVDIHLDNNLALHKAVEYGKLDVTKHLLHHGGFGSYSSSMIGTSASNGHFEVVKFFVENGADIHANSEFALKSSAKNNHFSIVKYLVEKGADIHVDNDYPFQYSAHHEYFKLIKFLIENGANIDAYKGGIDEVRHRCWGGCCDPKPKIQAYIKKIHSEWIKSKSENAEKII